MFGTSFFAEESMLEKVLTKVGDWVKKFWGLILGLAIVVGLLSGITDIIGFVEGMRAPTATLPSSPTVEPTATQTATPLPVPSPTPTLGPFQFIELPTRVKAGEDVTVCLQAPPDAVCFLDFYTPGGNKSTTRGLGQVFPDSQGKCSWEWHISANTSLGTAELDISINDVHEIHEVEIVE
jgi:hypothetical protein